MARMPWLRLCQAEAVCSLLLLCTGLWACEVDHLLLAGLLRMLLQFCVNRQAGAPGALGSRERACVPLLQPGVPLRQRPRHRRCCRMRGRQGAPLPGGTPPGAQHRCCRGHCPAWCVHEACHVKGNAATLSSAGKLASHQGHVPCTGKQVVPCCVSSCAALVLLLCCLEHVLIWPSLHNCMQAARAAARAAHPKHPSLRPPPSPVRAWARRSSPAPPPPPA